MKCVDCEHFHITYLPIKADGGGYWDLGRAMYEKHPGMYVDFGTKSWLKKLVCVEEQNNE